MSPYMPSALLIAALVSWNVAACGAAQEDSRDVLRLQEPRLAPLAELEWSQRQSELLSPYRRSDGTVLNVLTTIGRHPQLLENYIPFVLHVAQEQTLPARDREMLILRIGWLCQAEYEFGQHTLIGKEAGLTDGEILRITDGPGDPSWSDFDAALIRAADELHSDAMISDATWEALSERYNERQLIDVIFTVGQYNLVSWAINSLGVPLEEGVPGFPADSRQ